MDTIRAKIANISTMRASVIALPKDSDVLKSIEYLMQQLFPDKAERTLTPTGSPARKSLKPASSDMAS